MPKASATRHGRLVEIFWEYCDMRGILRCSSNDCWPQGCLLGWRAGVTVFGIFGVQDVKFPPRPGELLSLDALYWFLHFNWFLLLFLLQNLFPAYCFNFNSVYLIQSIFFICNSDNLIHTVAFLSYNIFVLILPISAMFVMLQSAVCIRVSIASNDFVICKCWSYF